MAAVSTCASARALWCDIGHTKAIDREARSQYRAKHTDADALSHNLLDFAEINTVQCVTQDQRRPFDLGGSVVQISILFGNSVVATHKQCLQARIACVVSKLQPVGVDGLSYARYCRISVQHHTAIQMLTCRFPKTTLPSCETSIQIQNSKLFSYMVPSTFPNFWPECDD
jgi:hypothetical protein